MGGEGECCLCKKTVGHSNQFGERMRNTISYLFLMIVAIIVLNPSAAKADINYTFITMTCDPGSQSATINAIWDWNESGEARIARHEKDTYFLGDLSKTGSRVTCGLSKHQVVSFSAAESGRAREHTASIYLNGNKIDLHTLSYGEWTLDIHATDNDADTIKYCPHFVDLSFQDASALKSNKRECRISHVKNGKLWKSETVTADSGEHP